MPAINQTGFVQSYKLELHEHPMADPFYFRVVVTDDERGRTNLTEWVLGRSHYSSDVDRHNGEYWAVTYGNVQQAIIATLKQALVSRNQVIVEGVEEVIGGMGGLGGQHVKYLETITIKAS